MPPFQPWSRQVWRRDWVTRWVTIWVTEIKSVMGLYRGVDDIMKQTLPGLWPYRYRVTRTVGAGGFTVAVHLLRTRPFSFVVLVAK